MSQQNHPERKIVLIKKPRVIIPKNQIIIEQQSPELQSKLKFDESLGFNRQTLREMMRTNIRKQSVNSDSRNITPSRQQQRFVTSDNFDQETLSPIISKLCKPDQQQIRRKVYMESFATMAQTNSSRQQIPKNEQKNQSFLDMTLGSSIFKSSINSNQEFSPQPLSPKNHSSIQSRDVSPKDNIDTQVKDTRYLRQVYNPKKNTIDLQKLNMALNYQYEPTDVISEQSRNRSIQESCVLTDILNQTLQKLKRRPVKMTGKLVPIKDNIKLHKEINVDEMTQEDKFYLIQKIESSMQKNIRYNQKNTLVFQDFSDDEELPKKREESLEVIEDLSDDDEAIVPIQSKTIPIKLPKKHLRTKIPLNEGQKQIFTKADLAFYLHPKEKADTYLKIQSQDIDVMQFSVDSLSNMINDTELPQKLNTFFP